MCDSEAETELLKTLSVWQHQRTAGLRRGARGVNKLKNPIILKHGQQHKQGSREEVPTEQRQIANKLDPDDAI